MLKNRSLLSVDTPRSVPLESIPQRCEKEAIATETRANIKERINDDNRVPARTFMLFLGKVTNEDEKKGFIRCANKYCARFQPSDAEARGWNKRNIANCMSWLCQTCVKAYDEKQFCEFCDQIYLENTSELTNLDGQDWAQCEASEECGRWAHVRCLAEKYDKTDKEVRSAEFQYICKACKTGKSNKRKRVCCTK